MSADQPSKESKPVWFITGCSTGFGRELSKILLSRGYRVVVTARDPAKIADLVKGHADTALALGLDVEQQPQIDAAVEAARRKFGRLDVLVNNAGYGYLAAIEEGEDADIRAMFETNFFGLAALTRAVLPIMRAQKSGAIVNISSMGGFIGFPGSGYYAATKFAVEGLSESLAKEVAPFGDQGRHRRAGAVPHRLGRPLAENAEASDRGLRGDRGLAPAPGSGLQRLAARRSRARGRGDRLGCRKRPSAAAAGARQLRLRRDGGGTRGLAQGVRDGRGDCARRGLSQGGDEIDGSGSDRDRGGGTMRRPKPRCSLAA